MNALSIILFLVYLYGLGYSLTGFQKDPFASILLIRLRIGFLNPIGGDRKRTEVAVGC
jgi:hypothetical protein